MSEKDSGIYDALNKGIDRAEGEYLMFLNSGDCLADSKILALVHDYIKNYPGTDIFYGDTWFKTGNPSKIWLHKHPPEVDLWFLKDNNLNHQFFINKSLAF